MENYIIDGKPYFDWYEDIKKWIKNEDYNRAEKLLIRIIDHIEKYDSNYGVAPAYYERLAILYSKLGRKQDEYDVLIRFSKQKHAPGKGPEILEKRLRKLKEKIYGEK